MSTWLYRAETKGIQAWILQSNKLKELKGGSRIIDELPKAAERLLQHIGKGTFVIKAAGNLEIEFESEDSAVRFAAVWPLVVDTEAPGLTVVQGWCKIAPDGDKRSLYQSLGQARNLPEVDLPQAGPLVARAGRTGLPAVSTDDKVLVDRALRMKLLESRESNLLSDLAPPGWEFITDNEDLGGGQEENYLAVIHADGNRVGLAVQGLQGQALKKFGEKLDHITKEAAKKSFLELSRHVGAHEIGDGQSRLPARPIVVGGDDFTVLVEASHALAFADFYLRTFEALAETQGVRAADKPLTSSAGVVFVKTSFPFDVAHEIAESLCKGAKDEASGSSILFHRVTTASTDTAWKDLKAAEQAPGGRHVTHGAYTLGQLRALEALALALRPLPRKAIRQWITLAREDQSRAQALMARTQEVAKPDVWRRFVQALAALQHGPDGWTPDGRTALPDALTWRTLTPGTAHRLWSHV